jgi:hypothetical protein
MDITGRTAWTVSKDGQRVQFTIEDLQQLFNLLAASGELIVADEASGRKGSGTEEIDISVADDAIQISLRNGENMEV